MRKLILALIAVAFCAGLLGSDQGTASAHTTGLLWSFNNVDGECTTTMYVETYHPTSEHSDPRSGVIVTNTTTNITTTHIFTNVTGTKPDPVSGGLVLPGTPKSWSWRSVTVPLIPEETYTVTSTSFNAIDYPWTGWEPLTFTVPPCVRPADATPPVITPDVDGVMGNNGWYTSNVTVSWTVTDPESAVSIISGCGSSTLTDDEITSLTCKAESEGGENEVTVTIKIDQTAPTLTCDVNPDSMWPPNHKMRDITASVSVEDATSGTAGFVLTSANSDEADSGTDEDDKPNDIQGFDVGTDDLEGQLRAERADYGDGRTYTLLYMGSDVAGNSDSCSVSVEVAHDKRKK